MSLFPTLPLLSVLSLAACATTQTPSVHTFTSGPDGFDTHTYWLDTGHEVVVIDTQFTPALAESMLAEIRRHTPNRIAYAVITHPNPDKFNGATVFQREGAHVVASARTAAAIDRVHAYKKAFFVGAGMFDEASYPPKATVDLTFEGRLDLPLQGDASVRLVELAHAGVTSDQTIALTGDAVFVGDLFANRAHAWLEGAITETSVAPDLASWHAALDEVLAIAGDRTLYPGRGVALPTATAVAEQHHYLAEAERLVRAELARHADPAAALAADGARIYQAIQDSLAAAFPDHGLPYLVGYGVYGLAHALAR